MTTSLEAVRKEHVQKLGQAAARMRENVSNGKMHVTGLPDYPDAPELLIPILNIHIQPDLYIESEQGPIIAFVPDSVDLGDDTWGERWKNAQRWADDHEARLLVLVSADKKEKAMKLAEKWKLDSAIIQTLN